MSAIDTFWEFFAIAVGLLVVLGGLTATLLRGRGGATRELPREQPTRPAPGAPGGDADRDARDDRDDRGSSVDTLPAPADDTTLEETLPPVTVPEVERPEAPQTRLQRLRARLEAERADG